jgi:ABC-2 type transport system ATP-binding protein
MVDAMAEATVAGQSTPAHPEEQAIAVDDLVRRFGEREALAGVTLTLPRGQTVAIFGPNGAGKTTLLRVLATLLLPHSGSVSVLGCALPEQAHSVRGRIGLVSHEPLLYRELTGRENLDFYARLYAIPTPAKRIDELLAATAMARRADEPVQSLSRGMVQRLAICRALLHSPELLLLDEPRAGLDPDASELVEPFIGRLSGVTRVLVTHDIEGGLAESDRAVGLRDGHVEFDAPVDQVSSATVRRLYAQERGAVQ